MIFISKIGLRQMILLFVWTVILPDTYCQPLTKSEILEELEIIFTSLKELHPGIAVYRDIEQVEQEYERIRHCIASEDTIVRSDYYNTYSELCGFINCGHMVVYDPEERLRHSMQGEKNPMKYEINTFGMSKLVIPTFYTVRLKKDGIHYKRYLRSFFKKVYMSNCQEVVVDIRGNKGGSVHMAAYLASFVVDTSFTLFNSVELTAYEKTTYEQYIKKNSFYRFRKLLTKKKNNKRLYWLHRELRPRKPKRYSPPDDVRFVILIDKDTFSAATMFAAICRAKSDAIFLGEETSGKCIGSGLSPLKLTLPYSNLIVYIPMAYIYLSTNNLANDQLFRGVIPDNVSEINSFYKAGHFDE